MPSLQVRELPDNIYHLLQERAQTKHRSLAQEAIVVLAKGLETSTTNKQRRQQILAKIVATAAVSTKAKAVDPLIWIHEGRDR
jgi:plasmid stability protein